MEKFVHCAIFVYLFSRNLSTIKLHNYFVCICLNGNSLFSFNEKNLAWTNGKSLNYKFCENPSIIKSSITNSNIIENKSIKDWIRPPLHKSADFKNILIKSVQGGQNIIKFDLSFCLSIRIHTQLIHKCVSDNVYLLSLALPYYFCCK